MESWSSYILPLYGCIFQGQVMKKWLNSETFKLQVFGFRYGVKALNWKIPQGKFRSQCTSLLDSSASEFLGWVQGVGVSLTNVGDEQANTLLFDSDLWAWLGTVYSFRPGTLGLVTILSFDSKTGYHFCLETLKIDCKYCFSIQVWPTIF